MPESLIREKTTTKKRVRCELLSSRTTGLKVHSFLQVTPSVPWIHNNCFPPVFLNNINIKLWYQWPFVAAAQRSKRRQGWEGKGWIILVIICPLEYIHTHIFTIKNSRILLICIKWPYWNIIFEFNIYLNKIYMCRFTYSVSFTKAEGMVVLCECVR